jgi:hypothetical protein
VLRWNAVVLFCVIIDVAKPYNINLSVVHLLKLAGNIFHDTANQTYLWCVIFVFISIRHCAQMRRSSEVMQSAAFHVCVTRDQRAMEQMLINTSCLFCWHNLAIVWCTRPPVWRHSTNSAAWSIQRIGRCHSWKSSAFTWNFPRRFTRAVSP